MKTALHRTLLCFVAMLPALPLLAPVALSQTAPAAPVDAATVARFDVNKNGRLDPSELDAWRADQEKTAAAVPKGETSLPSADIVELSPFQVSASTDKGYYASNTLSGTRINTKLEDLGASISVVTRQQMEDLALLDINDVFLYEANTEGTGTYTDFTIDRNGAVTDNVSGDPNNANRIRGITSANQARGNFATSGRVPLDPINIDAVEISRGPNSTIFGLGNASGTVNVIPARANLQRASSAAEFRFDNHGSMRSSLDLNRPLLRDKLAVRGSAVFQQEEFVRRPSVTRSKRYNGMVTYQPFKNTTVRGAIEYYENFARRPNFVLPRDGISYWEQVGRPTWDPSTSTVTRNGVRTVVPYNNNQATETGLFGPGLESGGSGLYARPSLFIEPDGSIPIWIVGRQSGLDTNNLATPNAQSGNPRLVESQPEPRTSPLAATIPSLSNKGYYDWSDINTAATNWAQNRVRTYTVELEQFFLRTPRQVLAAQLGWNREEADNYSRNFIGQGSDSPMVVYIDVNEKLTDGRVNPFLGRPYVNALEPSATRNPFFRDIFRGQLAYQLKFSDERGWTRWLGDHAFSGYGEYKNTINRNLRFRDAILDDHAWLLPGANRGNGAAAARGYYRYYLGDNKGDNIDYAPPAWTSAAGTYTLNWYNQTAGQWVAEKATLGEAYANVGNTANRRNLIKTEGGVMQNHLLQDRVVTTFGLREDRNYNRDSAGTAMGADGIHPDLASNRTWPNPWFLRSGKTKQYGAVVKPLRSVAWLDRRAEQGGVSGFVADVARSLNFHYNRSDSFFPSTVAQNLVGEMLPDPSGHGKDYGFSINVLGDNRLVVRFNQYENTQANSRAGDSGTIATRAARIDFSNTTGGSDRFNLYRNAREWVIGANPGWTEAQVATEVARQMGFPEDQLARMNAYTISDTSDVSSRGKEIEVNYNPNRFWTSRVTVGQQRTVDNRLSPAIGEYIAGRMPLWLKITDPRSNTPWWTTKYGGTSPEDFYVTSVRGAYKLATANEGKPKSQVRQWRVNLFSTLQLAAVSDHRFIKRFAVNGAVRWEDKGAIGFLGDPNDPNAYDPNRPIFDRAHLYLDAGLIYNQRILSDRVRMRLQLNVRNLAEGGRLQPIGALPDGRIHTYRIIDPRQFFLTASFSM